MSQTSLLLSKGNHHLVYVSSPFPFVTLASLELRKIRLASDFQVLGSIVACVQRPT